MAEVTPELLQKSVAKFLGSPVEVPSFSSGARDVLLVRERVFDLLVQALVLDPEAIYYLLWLGKNRLTGKLKSLREKLETMRVASEQLRDRRYKPVTRFDDLVTARVALLDVDAAAAKSASGSVGTGVTRFTAAVEKFVRRELVPNVMLDDEVVDTPRALRQLIQTTWRLAVQEILELDDAVAAFTGALSSYSSLRLPERAVRSLTEKLRTRVTEIEDHLAEGNTEAETQELFLDLLVAKSLLSRVTGFSVPKRILASGASAEPTNPLTGASAEWPTPYGVGVYVVEPGRTLTVEIDGVQHTALVPSEPEQDGPLTSLLPGAGHVRAETIVDAINATGFPATLAAQQLEVDFLAATLPLAGWDNKLIVVHSWGESGADLDDVGGWIELPAWAQMDGITTDSSVYIPSGPNAGVYAVSLVDAALRRLTLSPAPAAAEANAAFVVSKPSTELGQYLGCIELLTSAPETSAMYYLASSVGGGHLDLSAALQDWDPATGPAGSFVAWTPVFSVFQARRFFDTITISAPPGSTLVLPSTADNDWFGVTGAAVTLGNAQEFELDVDAAALGAGAGDRLTVGGTTYGVLSAAGTAVSVDATVPYPGVADTYVLERGVHIAYDEAVKVLGDSWSEANLLDLELAVIQVAQGRQSLALSSRLTARVAELDAITAALSAVVVRGRNAGVDAAIQMMREHGMDRGVDLLLSLKLHELFNMPPDGVSYSTNLVRAAAEATRVVAPVSKDTRPLQALLADVDAGSDLGR